MPITSVMGIDVQILIFALSLIAIFALAGLAKWLGLGGKPNLTSEDSARIVASQIVDGFTADEIGLDSDGQSALAKDASGQIMVIKTHGDRHVGRILDTRASARAWADQHEMARRRSFVEVDCGDRLFGMVRIHLDNPEIWERVINREDVTDNA